MKSLMAAPFIPISKNMSSHRAAQAVIYADQLKNNNIPITVNMTMELYKSDFNEYDTLYIYHGNDWSGSLNLFGGLYEFPHIYNTVNFSKFKGKVYSLNIKCPDYYSMLKHKFNLCKEKQKEHLIHPLWNDLDWDNLKRIINEAETIDPNMLNITQSIVIGDSHAISLYRPGWMMNSVQYKTLYGALNIGLNKFLLNTFLKFENIDLYFGNIDIRHHLMRRDNPEEATRLLVNRYFDQAAELNANVTIYEPLPIENIKRSIPKTGWYKNQPYYGTWEQRDNIRNIFIDQCIQRSKDTNVKFYQWNNYMKNNKGELDFKYMETPKSVHLSREYYPFWTGKEFNNNTSSIENLFE